ncbi:MAG TPA: peptide ABC transporter substrate-binding protein, partial [Burkholderiaceae bacterium]|nr:peptide ABC transporter substrate-binding protein [Burkholderiaceae bacterium]
MRGPIALFLLGTFFSVSGCDRITNSPHATGAEQTNTFFTAFEERSPRYLDPTASYAIDETPYTYSVYEPLYRFHYLKRPYQIEARIAETVAVPRFLDKTGNALPVDARGEDIAEAVYDIPIKRGVRYAPHPAFTRDASGKYRYHALTAAESADKRTPFDFAD